MKTPELATEFCFTGQFLELIFDRGKAKYIQLAVVHPESPTPLIIKSDIKLDTNSDIQSGMKPDMKSDRHSITRLTIKLTKQARATLVQSSPAGIAIPLQPQDTVQIIGVRTVDRSGQPKWKAHRIDRIHTVHGNGLSQEPEQGSSANDESIYPGSDRSLSTSWQTARLSTPDLALRTPLPPVAIRPKKLKILTCHKSGCAKKGGSRQCQILQTLLHDRGLGQHVTVETTGCLGKCSMAPNLILMPGKKRLSGMKPEAIVDLVEHLHHQWGHAASADWKEEAT